MAMSRNQQQLTWSTATSVTLSTNTESECDPIVFDDSDVAALLQIEVDNQGTPTSGDTLTVRIKPTLGDNNADASDDYDTVEHCEQYLLDTVAANFPGEDPARLSIPLTHLIAAKRLKIGVVWNSAAPGTRNAVVRGRLATLRAA